MPSSRYNSELVSVGYGTPPDHVMRKKKYTCYYLKIRLIPLDSFLLEMSMSTTLHSPALNNAVLQKNSDWIGVRVAVKCKKEGKKESKVFSNKAPLSRKQLMRAYLMPIITYDFWHRAYFKTKKPTGLEHIKVIRYQPFKSPSVVFWYQSHFKSYRSPVVIGRRVLGISLPLKGNMISMWRSTHPM